MAIAGLWTSFFLENFHFTVSILTAFVCFAASWLYADALLAFRRIKGVSICAGWFILALSFLFESVFLETSLFPTFLLEAQHHIRLIGITRLIAYALIIAGLSFDHLQKLPKITRSFANGFGVLGISTGAVWAGAWLLPLASFGAAFMYLRRATKGLERHVWMVSMGVGLLFLHELLAASSLLQSTSNATVYRLIAPHGPVWIVRHIVLFFAAMVLGRWVWRYLLKRVYTQLFMTFVSMTIVIFLITTFAFTVLLLQRMQESAMDYLRTNSRVLSMAINSKKAEMLSDAQFFAQDARLRQSLASADEAALSQLAQAFLLRKNQAFLVITDPQGRVITRGEGTERLGFALSDTSLIEAAARGEAVEDTVVAEGVLSPVVSVRSAAPVYGEGAALLGVVMMGVVIDSAFLDGIKAATGLDISIYGGNTLSTTTLFASDNKSRWVGHIEGREAVLEDVLGRGASAAAPMDILGTPYFVAYSPLVNSQDKPIGMMSVASPQLVVWRAAGRSIQLSFIMAVLLIVASVIPAHIIGRKMAYQLR